MICPEVADLQLLALLHLTCDRNPIFNISTLDIYSSATFTLSRDCTLRIRMSHLPGSGSIAPPAYSPTKPTFASISIIESDTIHVLQLPLRDIDGLRDVIKKSWAKGIQKEQVLYSSCHEFKLRGKPWNVLTWTGSENIHARILMREIFAYLYSAGWILRGNNDELFIFCQQQTVLPECDWISVTLSGLNGLRLVGASTELIVAFRNLLNSMDILQDERWLEEENNAWEFKMKKRPSMLLSEIGRAHV